MIWKVMTAVLAVSVLASLTLNLFLVFSAIDHGVTASYQQQSLYEFANQTLAAQRFCSQSLAGKSEAEVLSTLRTIFPEEEPFVKEGAVHTTWLRVGLTAQRKASGCVVDELVETWAKPASERWLPATH